MLIEWATLNALKLKLEGREGLLKKHAEMAAEIKNLYPDLQMLFAIITSSTFAPPTPSKEPIRPKQMHHATYTDKHENFRFSSLRKEQTSESLTAESSADRQMLSLFQTVSYEKTTLL
ncbi:unnamed protein product [Musa acuminata subsp. burmannicoides]